MSACADLTGPVVGVWCAAEMNGYTSVQSSTAAMTFISGYIPNATPTSVRTGSRPMSGTLLLATAEERYRAVYATLNAPISQHGYRRGLDHLRVWVMRATVSNANLGHRDHI